jgi:hypothetical protein
MEAQFGRVARLEAEVSALITASVDEIPTKVENLRHRFTEARKFAAGAHTKAASTEAAQFGRVARLEAEMSSLRTASVIPPPPSGWNSALVPDFPKLFEHFKKRQFTRLWCGSRDGFGARDFQNRCDRHPNTLILILDMKGTIFGGFTPMEWESPRQSTHKADPNLKSFVFTLKNPHSPCDTSLFDRKALNLNAQCCIDLVRN